jgi:predicted nucleotidyltransferase component of viral defense system
VFGGGTALSRAHKLTKRMSEDVDLKIVRDKPPSRGELRKLRTTITDALLGAGFVFDPDNDKHRLSMYKGTTPNTNCPTNRLPKARASCVPTSRLKPRCFRCGAKPWTSR